MQGRLLPKYQGHYQAHPVGYWEDEFTVAAEIKKLGIKQIIISTEENPVVSVRAKKLKITCLQGIENKKIALMDYCRSNDIDHENVAYVGNDINDMEAIKFVGLTFCPADAHNSIKAISDHILNSKGGDAVTRELFDILINQQGE